MANDNITSSAGGNLSNLFQALGLEKLDPKKQEELAAKVTELVLKRVFLATLEKLDDDGKEKYEQLVEQNTSPELMEQFLNAHIPNYSQFVEKIISELGEEMKRDMQ